MNYIIREEVEKILLNKQWGIEGSTITSQQFDKLFTLIEDIQANASKELIESLAGSAHPYCECNNGLNAYELAKKLYNNTYSTKKIK